MVGGERERERGWGSAVFQEDTIWLEAQSLHGGLIHTGAPHVSSAALLPWLVSRAAEGRGD